jgi:hypothetical protein
MPSALSLVSSSERRPMVLSAGLAALATKSRQVGKGRACEVAFSGKGSHDD